MIQVLDNVTNLSPGDFGLQFGVNATELRVRARSTASVANTDFTIANSYTPHQNNFFVIKAEQNFSGFEDRISVWVNPTDLSSETAAGAPDAVFNTASLDQTNGIRAVDTFGFRTVNFANNSNAAYDAFRLGSDWESVTPHDDVTVIKATNDAHVHRNSPNSNFTADPVMELKNSASSAFERKAYMRFDLNGIDPATVGDAYLSLTMTHDGGNLDTDQTNAWTFNVFGLADGDPGENWDSNTITWNNAPANDLADGGAMLANAELLGQFTIGGSPTEQILLGESELPGLADFVGDTTDDLLTFIVTRDTTGDGGGDIGLDTVHGLRSINFDVANGTDFAPTLLFTTAAVVPEPTSITIWSLVGLCAATLAFRLRQRRRA